MEEGFVDRAQLLEPAVLQLYAELHESLDPGESSSLALAVHEACLVACDERGAFRREANVRLGPGRLFTTPGLLLVAIRQGQLTVDEADAAKRHLEQKRFRMSFRSFGDIIE
ncbi:MAG TPA: hypothetical protein VNB06_09640 [Thermoanaerobaculia bacterium]|nr:hypothetical protein [Thermoanaerobaculia bacterium]